MYNRSDKSRTRHSKNMVSSNQVAEQMAAIEQIVEQRHNDLEENQCKITDTMNQMVSDVSIGGDGGISPIIETKLLDTATAAVGTTFLLLMAQT